MCLGLSGYFSPPGVVAGRFRSVDPNGWLYDGYPDGFLQTLFEYRGWHIAS